MKPKALLTVVFTFFFPASLLTLAATAGLQAATPHSSAGIVETRLLTPISSVTSTQGSAFRSVVIAPFEVSGRVMLPPGTLVYGNVVSRKSVGLGLIRERARLTLHFREYELADGRRFALRARLARIDNSREYVNSKGDIQGILAADSPQVVLGGMWIRPTMTLFQRSFVGLTGVSGRIWASYSMGPIGAVALFATRCLIFRMPEPEIQLPVGAELKIAITSFASDAPFFEPAEPLDLPPQLTDFLSTQPWRVEKINGRTVSDIINVAFQGTRDELLNAFRAAGWQVAAPITARSASRVLAAFTGKNGYAGAPASRLMYEDSEPDIVFEKSFNNILKRHHVRVWQATLNGQPDGEPIWLGAATHDIGAGFDAHSMMFAHRIQAHIDSERSKIVNDLVFTGCSQPAGYVDRPDAARAVSDAGIVTDGRLAVLQMRACGTANEASAIDHSRPTLNLPEQVIRRMILEGRQYILRENPIFWTFRAYKWTRAAYRPTPNVIEE